MINRLMQVFINIFFSFDSFFIFKLNLTFIIVILIIQGFVPASSKFIHLLHFQNICIARVKSLFDLLQEDRHNIVNGC